MRWSGQEPCSQGHGPWESTPHSLSLESALDDLDLNEFGVAALEKTFDNSTVTHPSNVTIGTGQGWPRGGIGFHL